MKSKIEELKESIGKTMSHNYSPTLRAKLIKVNRVNCVLEVTNGEYSKDKDYCVGLTFTDSINRVWNALYY